MSADDRWPSGVDPDDYSEIDELRIDWTPGWYQTGADGLTERVRGRLGPDDEIRGVSAHPLAGVLREEILADGPGPGCYWPLKDPE